MTGCQDLHDYVIAFSNNFCCNEIQWEDSWEGCKLLPPAKKTPSCLWALTERAPCQKIQALCLLGFQVRNPFSSRDWLKQLPAKSQPGMQLKSLGRKLFQKPPEMRPKIQAGFSVPEQCGK